MTRADLSSVAGKLPRVTSLRAQQVARLSFKAVKRKASTMENGDNLLENGPTDEAKSTANNTPGGIHPDSEKLALSKKVPSARKRGRPPKNAHKRVTLNGVNGQSVENGEFRRAQVSETYFALSPASGRHASLAASKAIHPNDSRMRTNRTRGRT